MNNIISILFFNNKNYDQKKQLFFAVLFPFFTLFALGINELQIDNQYFDNGHITNTVTILYFLFFFCFSDSYLRKLMFVMLFLSYLGEVIFCTLLEMYEYQTAFIPLYVPFGHAIVYASGYVFAQTEQAVKKDHILKKYFTAGFILLFLSVGLLLKDLFTVILGALFFLLLKRKKWQNLYYFIAVCVIFIELVGTYFKCWRWEPKIFGLIPTANPPMGAVFIYAGGDVLLSKIVDYWKLKTTNKRIEIVV